MAEWFECKVTYQKENQDGKIKKATEQYLVDAVSFTEAEAIITKEVAGFISGEFDVAAVKKEKIYAIVREAGAGTWFKVGVAFVQVDEETEKEKRDNVTLYFESNDIFLLPNKVKDYMKEMLVDYIVTSIKETKIIDIFEPSF
jgi:uncharacterized protein YneR